MTASPITTRVESQPGTELEPHAAADEHLYLVGRPTLKQFMRYVRGHAVNHPGEAALTDQWQRASRVVAVLETEEAGLADDPPMRALGPEYEPLLMEFLKDPLVRYGYNTVPTDVTLVELDRMVVYQKHIDLTFVRELERKLGPAPSDAEIFRTCLAYDHPRPPAKWTRVRKDTFVFVSSSNDLRFLGALALEPEHLNHPPPGTLVGAVALTVGFGSNFLNAIYAERRLILNNGSHRAYALRKLGVTHVPCIVQHASTRAELEVVAPSEVAHSPDTYLKARRPALLKDYFDPRLHTVMPVHRRQHQVTVRFEVEEGFLPAL